MYIYILDIKYIHTRIVAKGWNITQPEVHPNKLISVLTNFMVEASH